jgi:hypothetical protein
MKEMKIRLPQKPSQAISMTSLTDKAKRRRRRDNNKKNQDQVSSVDGSKRDRDRNRDQSLKKRKSRKSSKKHHKNQSKNIDKQALDKQTEHTSNLTEHSRKCKFNDKESITCDIVNDDSINSFDDETEKCDGDDTLGAASSEHTTTTIGNSVETRESRFQSLLNQWRTRENEQKEKVAATDDAGSKASYLSEDEDHSCFEGVLKHWRKRDDKGSNEETTTREATVEIDDDPSEVSSLGESLKLGCGSDSRFDFAFDARFDYVLKMSPTKSKKKTKTKKATDPSVATFEAAMDASMTGLDVSESTMEASKSTMEASESTMEASESTMEASEVSLATTESKRKKKSKSKKTKMKKSKKPLDSTETTFNAEDSPVLDEGGSKRAYLPKFLSPKYSPATNTAKKTSLRKGPLPMANETIPFFPSLLESLLSATTI